jgi:IS1 family transposase
LDTEELAKGYGTKWIWTAFSPDNRLIICHKTGNRTLNDCRKYFKKLLDRITDKPLFTSDELVHYRTVLLENFSTEEPVCPTGKRGRPHKGTRIIDRELDYAVVHKTRVNGKIVKVEKKIVFGDEKRIEEKLTQCVSNKINTSYIERSNGTLRQMDANLRRKSLTFAKEMEYFEAKVSLSVYFYNFIRPHSSLSKNPDKTRTPRTPALCAKITDSVWDVKIAFKVPYMDDN